MKEPQELPAHWISSLVGSVALLALLWLSKETLFKGYTEQQLALERGLLAFAVAVPVLAALSLLWKKAARPEASGSAPGTGYFALLEQSPVGIGVIDPSGRHHLYANRAVLQRLGYGREEFFRLPIRVVFADAPAAPWPPAALPVGEVLHGERRLRQRDGSTFPADVAVRKLEDGRLLWSFFEIAEQQREQLQTLARDAEETAVLFEGLVQSLPGIFYVCDQNGRLLRWNKHLETLSGFPAEKLARAPLLHFIPEEDRSLVGGKLLEAFDTGTFSMESCFLTRDRRRLPFLFSGVRVRLHKTVGLVGIGCDLSEHKETTERLQQLAHFDPLTELPNRVLFNDRLTRALAYANRYGREFAVLFVDLDFFKTVNDMFGHDAGDSVLRQTSQRISECLRESDTVARIGGDEFLILLPELASTAEACIVADKVLAAITQPVSVDGFSVSVSCSVGIAIYPRHGGDAESLVKAADEAMYQAKRAGKNRYRVKDEEPAPQRFAAG
jgi:diguanylate cyclase (GGDEF)-like protein/PAS domain S-box-containing protein